MTRPPVSPVAQVSAHPESRRHPFLARLRLSTLLLLVPIPALLIGLFVEGRREHRLLSALSIYRNPKQEGIFEALEERIVPTYTDDSPLDEVFKSIKALTTKNPKLPKIPNGIPIYIDPLGLQEAEKSMNSRVKRPPMADQFTLGEHLERILEPLGLAYEVKDNFLMITSKEFDRFTDHQGGKAPLSPVSRCAQVSVSPCGLCRGRFGPESRLT